MEGGHGIRVLLTGNVGVNLAWERPRRLLERSSTFRMERGTGDGMSSRVEWGDGRDVAMRKRSKVAARVVDRDMSTQILCRKRLTVDGQRPISVRPRVRPGWRMPRWRRHWPRGHGVCRRWRRGNTFVQNTRKSNLCSRKTKPARRTTYARSSLIR